LFLDHAEDDDEEEAVALQPRYPWEGSDRDYQYEEVCHFVLSDVQYIYINIFLSMAISTFCCTFITLSQKCLSRFCL
jgi:hypothetical protein